MPWKDEEFTRPRHELLAATRRRGEQLRQRRRLGYGLAAPGLLLVVAIPAALALNGEGGRPTTVAASGGGTVTTMSTTTTLGVTTTEALPTMGAAASPTTAAGGQTSTTLRPTTTTTAPAPEPEPTTTTTPGIPTCDRTAFTVSRPTTDKSSYQPGEQVSMRATLSYNNPVACGSAVHNRAIKVLDATGKEVFGVVLHADFFTQPVHQPDATEVIQHTWPQTSFAVGGQAPPGTYSIVISGDEIASPPATVQLLAG